jgi:hypothetical protein
VTVPKPARALDLDAPGARAVFLRGLGVAYACAFVSLGAQILGLYGANGILPIAELLDAITEQVGLERFWRWPTVFWLDASDPVLTGACVVGAGLGALVAAGRFTRPALGGAWALYLSVCSVGRVFMGYQWDALLLETGALALVFAGRRSLASLGPLEAVAGLFVRLLALKLFFFSGTAKLMSGDATWRDGTALLHHFETQPLPTWVGAYVHHLPDGVLRLGAVIVFVGQVLLPWGLLLPWGVRRFTVAGLFGLQVLIALTGNYGFFNVLAVVLLLPAVPDRAMLRMLPPSLRAVAARRLADATSIPRPRRSVGDDRLPDVAPRRPRTGETARGAALVLVALLNLGTWLGFHAGWEAVPPALRKLEQAMRPLQLSNRYGLFAVMTTERPEIRVEGSRDGETWRAYELRFQPRPDERPRFVAPHMPRLDWQMWFAALRSGPPSWFGRFVERLLQGSPVVLDLLAHDPFSGEPPRFVRATIEDCAVAPVERLSEGRWWRCRDSRIYFPVTRDSASVPGRR